jgi:phage shock protein C
VNLRRSTVDYKIAGICGGLAEYIGISSTMARIGFVLFVLVGGLSIITYFILWIIIPKQE